MAALFSSGTGDAFYRGSGSRGQPCFPGDRGPTPVKAGEVGSAVESKAEGHSRACCSGPGLYGETSRPDEAGTTNAPSRGTILTLGIYGRSHYHRTDQGPYRWHATAEPDGCPRIPGICRRFTSRRCPIASTPRAVGSDRASTLRSPCASLATQAQVRQSDQSRCHVADRHLCESVMNGASRCFSRYWYSRCSLRYITCPSPNLAENIAMPPRDVAILKPSF